MRFSFGAPRAPSANPRQVQLAFRRSKGRVACIYSTTNKQHRNLKGTTPRRQNCNFRTNISISRSLFLFKIKNKETKSVNPPAAGDSLARCSPSSYRGGDSRWQSLRLQLYRSQRGASRPPHHPLLPLLPLPRHRRTTAPPRLP